MDPTLGDMVYRYESAEDAFEENPQPGTDLPLFQPVPTTAAGPSPSRFPAPSLPRVSQPVPPAADPVPIRSAVQVPAPTSAPDRSRSRRSGDGRSSRGGRGWQIVVGGAAVLMLLGLCGLGGAVLLIDRTPTDDSSPNGQAAPTAPGATAPDEQAAGGPLDSRDVDRQPLTVKEVFPGKKLVVGVDRHEYQVLKTQSGSSCAVAATGEIADLLVTLGCSQVVRATLRSPDDDHLVTVGLFNLTDLATAQRVRERIRPLLDDRRGRFRGMPAGDDTESVATAAARVAWQVRGHYVAYCLVTRDDAGAVPADDKTVREIIYDLIELHLDKGVLDRRAAGVSVDQPTVKATSPSATPRAGDRKTPTPSASANRDDPDTGELPGD
ncbi:hypothetical protein GA0070216_103341 [Micromonospora matsumotoense]|uniref:Uncharacterized protein n=2 Tax=Micromonospora matsumotoense TaxID=121616 RepID=A0A1C4WGY6_9ACTN|nr:hypothetical protein GA0070216_103341 [Micromonospora matsumotoense]